MGPTPHSPISRRGDNYSIIEPQINPKSIFLNLSKTIKFNEKEIRHLGRRLCHSTRAIAFAPGAAITSGMQAVFDRRSSSMDFSNVLIASNNNEQDGAYTAMAEHQHHHQLQQQQQQTSRLSLQRHPSKMTKLGN